jgi:membrane-bound metal-dependent hydrolase YbcI (DUF457 family)
MPSPIAHTAAGYLVYRFYPPQQSIPRSRISLAITALSSMLPDVDSVIGLLFRDFKRYHNGITHSFLVGLILSNLVGATAKRNHNLAFPHLFTFILIPYELHILMDYLARGKRGVMLLWPFSKRRFRFTKKLFYGVRWDEGIRSGNHLKMVITEIAFIAVFYLFLRLIQRLFNRVSIR